MSYILDALKKMEHEKSRKARKAGMTSIAGELFMDERPQPARGGVGKTIFLVVVTSLIAIAATWYFLRPAERHGEAKPRPASVPTAIVPPAPAPVVRPVPPPQPPPAVAPQPVAAVPQKPAAGVMQPHPAVPARPAPGKNRGELRRSRAVQPVPEPTPAAASPGVSSDIKVSGIAWQDDRKARRVVVNGFLMKEGGVVAGATIVEILPDRVRFSQGGRDFELAVVVSGAAGAPAK